MGVSSRGLLLLLLSIVGISHGQGVLGRRPRVGTCTEVVPFVLNPANGQTELRGFDMQFWNILTSVIDQESGLHDFKSSDMTRYEFSQLLSNIETGVVDLGLCCIFVTPAREAKMNFAQSYFQSGIRIAIRAEETSVALEDVLRKVVGLIPYFAVVVLEFVVLMAIVYAHVLWFIERQKVHSFAREYLRGVLQGFYTSIVTATTVGYGDKAPKQFLGRVLTLVWMVVGLVLYGIFLGSISSNLTVQSLGTSADYTFESLRGRNVGTMSGTVSEDAVIAAGGLVQGRSELDDLIKDLVETKIVDFIVSDGPTLLDFERSHDTINVASASLLPKSCAIAVNTNVSLQLISYLNDAIAITMDTDKFDSIRMQIDAEKEMASTDSVFKPHASRLAWVIALVMLGVLLIGVADKIIRTWFSFPPGSHPSFGHIVAVILQDAKEVSMVKWLMTVFKLTRYVNARRRNPGSPVLKSMEIEQREEREDKQLRDESSSSNNNEQFSLVLARMDRIEAMQQEQMNILRALLLNQRTPPPANNNHQQGNLGGSNDEGYGFVDERIEVAASPRTIPVSVTSFDEEHHHHHNAHRLNLNDWEITPATLLSQPPEEREKYAMC